MELKLYLNNLDILKNFVLEFFKIRFILFLKKDEELFMLSLRTKNIESEHKKVEEMEKMRKKQLKRRKASKLFREILFNLMFLWILFVVSYSNKDVNSYNYKNSVSNLFLEGIEEVLIQ